MNGKVFQITSRAEYEKCKKSGGKFFLKKEDAEKYCRVVPRGWCCYKGKVFQATKADCEKRGGKWFLKKEDAVKYCRRIAR